MQKTDDPRKVRSVQKLSIALFQLLQERPFEQITVKEISVCAKVSTLTFYHHFSNKEELLDYCFRSSMEPVMQALPSELGKCRTRKEGLERIVSLFIHQVSETRVPLSRLFRTDSSKTLYWAIARITVEVFRSLRQEYPDLFTLAGVPDDILDTFVSGGICHLVYYLLKERADLEEETVKKYILTLLRLDDRKENNDEICS